MTAIGTPNPRRERYDKMAKAEWIYAANHETFDPEGIHELDMLSTLVEECNAHLAKQDTSELAVRIQLTGTGITPGWYEAYTSTGDWLRASSRCYMGPQLDEELALEAADRIQSVLECLL